MAPKKSKSRSKETTAIVQGLPASLVKPGTQVLAKCSYYPWWPGQILSDDELPPHILKAKSKRKRAPDTVTVYFYGSLDYDFLRPDTLRLFDPEEAKAQLAKGKVMKNKSLAEGYRVALEHYSQIHDTNGQLEKSAIKNEQKRDDAPEDRARAISDDDRENPSKPTDGSSDLLKEKSSAQIQQLSDVHDKSTKNERNESRSEEASSADGYTPGAAADKLKTSGEQASNAEENTSKDIKSHPGPALDINIQTGTPSIEKGKSKAPGSKKIPPSLPKKSGRKEKQAVSPTKNGNSRDVQREPDTGVQRSGQLQSAQLHNQVNAKAQDVRLKLKRVAETDSKPEERTRKKTRTSDVANSHDQNELLSLSAAKDSIEAMETDTRAKTSYDSSVTGLNGRNGPGAVTSHRVTSFREVYGTRYRLHKLMYSRNPSEISVVDQEKIALLLNSLEGLQMTHELLKDTKIAGIIKIGRQLRLPSDRFNINGQCEKLLAQWKQLIA